MIFSLNRANHAGAMATSRKKTSVDKLIFFPVFFSIIIYHRFIHLLIADRYRRQTNLIVIRCVFFPVFFWASIK